MIIGVLSDTHRNRRAVDQAFRFFAEHGVQTVFHLGDLCQDIRDKDIEFNMEVVCVAGNMDHSSSNPAQRIFEADGVKFLLTHGHTLDVRNTLRYLVEEAKAKNCQAALYGHTHMPFNARQNGILVINPGSAAEPRGNSKASVALIDTNGGDPRVQVYWLWEENRINSQRGSDIIRWSRPTNLVRRIQFKTTADLKI